MVIILVLMTISACCTGSMIVRALARVSTEWKHRWHVEKKYMNTGESSVY